MPDNDVRGPLTPQVPGATSRALVDAALNVDAAFKTAEVDSKKFNLAIKALEKSLESSQKVTSAATLTNKVYMDNLQKLEVGSEAAAKGSKELADQFSKSLNVMSDAQSEAFEKMMKDIDAARKTADSTGDLKTMAMLSEQTHKLSLERWKSEVNNSLVKNKLLTREGGLLGKIEGFAGSSADKFKLQQEGVLDFIGQFFKLNSGSMEALADAAGVVSIIISALVMGLKNESKYMGEAARAGMDLGSRGAASMDTAHDALDKYQTAVINSSSILGFSRDEVSKFAAVMNGEFGRSITSNIGQSAQLATDLAAVGTSFGMAADDAVRLGTKLGVLSRASSTKDTAILFENLGDASAKFHTTMGALADPMMQLAEMTGRAGANSNFAAVALNRMVESTSNLNALGEKFGSSFSSLRDADKIKMMQNAVAQISKLSDINWMAFTMGRGESFMGAMQRVGNAGADEKLNMIDTLKQRINYDRMESRSKGEGNYLLGKLLSNGTMEGWSAMQFGAQMARIKGGVSQKELERLQGGSIQASFAARANIGEFIAGGGDPLHWIGNTLDKMLGMVQQIMGQVVHGVHVLDVVAHLGMGGGSATGGDRFGASGNAMNRQAKPMANGGARF